MAVHTSGIILLNHWGEIAVLNFKYLHNLFPLRCLSSVLTLQKIVSRLYFVFSILGRILFNEIIKGYSSNNVELENLFFWIDHLSARFFSFFYNQHTSYYW